MSSMRALVARAPLTSFFVLAIGLSWIAWGPYVLSMNGLGLEPELRFPVILGNTQLTGVLPGAYLGPIAAAFLVTWLAEGREGLKRWGRRLFRWNVNWKWYAGVILSVPLALIVFTLPFSSEIKAPAAAAFSAYVIGLVLQMVTTGLAEEPGWRDFALPHLQPKFGPMRGTLILGVLWGIWHLPLFLTEWGGYPDVPWWVPVEFVVTTIAISFVMTWVFNRSGESLPIAMLAHTSINNTLSTVWAEIFPAAGQHDASHATLAASAVIGLVLVITTRGKLGYRPPVVAAPEAAPETTPAPAAEPGASTATGS